ncbi:AraC family transcriptional regulator [Nocardia sp. NPDC004278]
MLDRQCTTGRYRRAKPAGDSAAPPNAGYRREQRIISQWRDRVRGELVRAQTADIALSAMIARRWGLHDPSHFARRFRTAYGMSPREWRQVAALAGG